MKNLIFAFLVLSAIACSKHEVDCDIVRCHCIYIQFSNSDCTPNGSELGWEWDQIRSDTIEFDAWGCPDKLNFEFLDQQNRTINSTKTPESVKKFIEAYPSTCNCQN